MNIYASAAAVQNCGYTKLQKPYQIKAKSLAFRIKEGYLIFIKRLQSLHSLLLILWSTTGEKLIHIHDTALSPALEREILQNYYLWKHRDSLPTRKENPWIKHLHDPLRLSTWINSSPEPGEDRSFTYKALKNLFYYIKSFRENHLALHPCHKVHSKLVGMTFEWLLMLLEKAVSQPWSCLLQLITDTANDFQNSLMLQSFPSKSCLMHALELQVPTFSKKRLCCASQSGYCAKERSAEFSWLKCCCMTRPKGSCGCICSYSTKHAWEKRSAAHWIKASDLLGKWSIRN